MNLLNTHEVCIILQKTAGSAELSMHTYAKKIIYIYIYIYIYISSSDEVSICQLALQTGAAYYKTFFLNLFSGLYQI